MPPVTGTPAATAEASAEATADAAERAAEKAADAAAKAGERAVEKAADHGVTVTGVDPDDGDTSSTRQVVTAPGLLGDLGGAVLVILFAYLVAAKIVVRKVAQADAYLIETEPPRASQMQKALITYLRGALPQMRQESSTLGREMRLIRSYLDLIKMRIEDRLQVEIAVPWAL